MQLSGAEEEVELTDTRLVLDRVLETLSPTIEGCRAQILVDTLPSVRMRELHLEQLLHNLIGNALKYRSNELPKIHVSAETGDGAHTFRISDNGIGVDPRFADQIFVIFKRLHSLEEYDGSGIGLAICQKIVQRYGGKIWVEPASRGSHFYFRIPTESRLDRLGAQG